MLDGISLQINKHTDGRIQMPTLPRYLPSLIRNLISDVIRYAALCITSFGCDHCHGVSIVCPPPSFFTYSVKNNSIILRSAYSRYPSRCHRPRMDSNRFLQFVTYGLQTLPLRGPSDRVDSLTVGSNPPSVLAGVSPLLVLRK